MSNETVIRVENLSKRYIIKHAAGQSSGDGLRHALQDAASAPLRALKRRLSGKPQVEENGVPSTAEVVSGPSSSSPSRDASSEEFWALKHVSFEVKRGEVLGIIGRNGAGKSTLLKILSRITEPTSGRIGIKGRVASLLEVGTGFHPELTGRENIFLNGAILGMSRAEVRRKFDEIVAFAEVEKFLDTPVKRYSSGMYVRLAFAVAAHLEPEILIVDEVLAVGDTSFQAKCLGKMGQIAAQESRTIFFVSHQLGAIQNLCTQALLLERGVLASQGETGDVIRAYVQRARMEAPKCQREGTRAVEISNFATTNILGTPQSEFLMGEALYVRFTLLWRTIRGEPEISVELREAYGGPVAHVANMDSLFQVSGEVSESRIIQLTLPNILLSPGSYTLSLWVGCGSETFDYHIEALTINVHQSAVVGRGTEYPRQMKVFLPSEWQVLT